jgi:hypothetical protein
VTLSAGEVAAAGALDLDHAGAEIGELTRAERRPIACSRVTTVMSSSGRIVSLRSHPRDDRLEKPSTTPRNDDQAQAVWWGAREPEKKVTPASAHLYKS